MKNDLPPFVSCFVDWPWPAGCPSVRTGRRCVVAVLRAYRRRKSLLAPAPGSVSIENGTTPVKMKRPEAQAWPRNRMADAGPQAENETVLRNFSAR